YYNQNMFIIKATTTNPSPLSLRHLFAFAVLLLTMSPATATATATAAAATAAANIPLTEQSANAVNGENNLLANQRHAEGEVVSRGQAVIDMVPMADRTAFIRYELARAMNRFNTTTNKSSARAINPRFFLNPNVLLNPTQLMTFEIFYKNKLLNIFADRTAFVRYELARAMNRFNTTTNKSSARTINPRFFLNPNVLLNPTQLMTFELTLC
ncbi:PREDICTED: uncharacterized protein LOC108368486, partial [Rhagoletis zephyria]|uniref:uncharacterized protein LOC108368486 n=1 Tax=Rhagoletis zephyria TaxID=28612 RepID=UPI00081183B8